MKPARVTGRKTNRKASLLNVTFRGFLWRAGAFDEGRRRWGAGRFRQDLEALLRDEDGVLPLRGERMVGRHDGPAVGELADVALAGIDHGLDGESHAGHELQALAGPPVMQDLRFLVEALADAVAAELAHHREACAL